MFGPALALNLALFFGLSRRSALRRQSVGETSLLHLSSERADVKPIESSRNLSVNAEFVKLASAARGAKEYDLWA